MECGEHVEGRGRRRGKIDRGKEIRGQRRIRSGCGKKVWDGGNW